MCGTRALGQSGSRYPQRMESHGSDSQSFERPLPLRITHRSRPTGNDRVLALIVASLNNRQVSLAMITQQRGGARVGVNPPQSRASSMHRLAACNT